MAEIEFAALKEMALHRGYKLLRSRRRLPGVGDYGKFGLADDKGKEILGFSDAGFTASAIDVQAFLQSNATSTWKQSVKITPKQKKQAAKGRSAWDQVTPEPKDVPASEPIDPTPASKEAPLTIRNARLSDAEELSKLLNGLEQVLFTATDIKNSLLSFSPKLNGAAVAARGSVIGVVAWSALPTLHRGIEGRITMLLVDPSHQREKIGTQLLKFAETALHGLGCDNVHVMNDYAPCNRDFLENRGYRQSGHGFTRERSLQ